MTTVVVLLLLSLLAAAAQAEITGKGTGAYCACAAAPPPPCPGDDAGAGGDASADGGADGDAAEEEEEEANLEVQKLFISGSAGALLALAVAGRRPKQNVSTWTEVRSVEVQTYVEPAAPSLDLPPVIQFLPPPPARPPRPPQPELVYEIQEPVPRLSRAVQTAPTAETAETQSDWSGYPRKAETAMQTAPEPHTFPAGVQTLGIPHTAAFAQATVPMRNAETQYHPDDTYGDITFGGTSSLPYHPLLPSGASERGSASGGGLAAHGSKPLMLEKLNQTDPQGVITIGVQTGSLFVRDVLTQTQTTETGSGGEVRVATAPRRP